MKNKVGHEVQWGSHTNLGGPSRKEDVFI